MFDTVPDVGAIEASAWGAAGGAVAGLLALSASVIAARFRWPWHDHQGLFRPQDFVFAAGLVVGAVVSASAHGQKTGAWPALIMGASTTMCAGPLALLVWACSGRLATCVPKRLGG